MVVSREIVVSRTTPSASSSHFARDSSPRDDDHILPLLHRTHSALTSLAVSSCLFSLLIFYISRISLNNAFHGLRCSVQRVQVEPLHSCCSGWNSNDKARRTRRYHTVFVSTELCHCQYLLPHLLPHVADPYRRGDAWRAATLSFAFPHSHAPKKTATHRCACSAARSVG